MLIVFYPRQRLHLFFGLFNFFLVATALNLQYFSGETSVMKGNIDGLLARMIGSSLPEVFLISLNCTASQNHKYVPHSSYLYIIDSSCI